MSLTLEQALSGFKLASQVRHLSPRTVEWYYVHLERFVAWMKTQHYPEDLAQIEPSMLRQFLAYLYDKAQAYDGHPLTPRQKRSLSPASVLAFYSSLSAFFHWCVTEELLGQNPMRNITRPKVPHKIVPTFSQDEIKALLKASTELPDDTAARTKAMLLFMVDTGVRITELTTLTVDNTALEDGRALVMGKGAKQRYVYFGSLARKALWRYLTIHRPKPLAGTNWLFLTREGQPLKMRQVQHDLNALAKRAGVTGVHPHRFRHTAAVQFLRNGGNVFALQKMLGHTTLDMVRRYVELASEDVEKAHRLASPADNWGLSG